MEKEDENKTNEPSAQWNDKIVFFNSFEEAEDYDNQWLASLSPEQHLQNAVHLIKRLYYEELQFAPLIGKDFKFG